ncbi:MAG: hypothetical protein NVSMB23_11050 [Myxococcales bacterium]
MVERIFLLSPANAAGVRMRMLLAPHAAFDLARRLREGKATLGEAFEFASSLYFRGKRAYARAFARPRAGAPGALVIAPGSGLLDEEERVTAERLRAIGAVPVDVADPRYLGPLQDAVAKLSAGLSPQAEVVLLGSIASDKYVGPLSAALGRRLLFPPAFAGRGDMSRGGLLLRAARSGEELPYAPVLDGALHGPRPPRLPRRTAH